MGTKKQALSAAPKYVREITLAIDELNLELHEHTNTVHGLKDLLLAQNREVDILAIKKLVAKECIDNEIIPENVRVFVKIYYKQKKIYCSSIPMGYLCHVSKLPMNFIHAHA